MRDFARPLTTRGDVLDPCGAKHVPLHPPQLQEEQRLGVEKRDLKRVAEAPANVANERAGPQDDGGAPSEGASPASPASKTPAVDVPTQPTAMPQPAGQLTVAGSAAVGAMGEPTPALVNDTRGGRAVGRVQVEEL